MSRKVPARLPRTVILILPLALWAGGGCGKGKSYIPAKGAARQALEAALTAWQNGQPAGKIHSASPPVQVVDSAWLKGQKLASYEDLDEESRSDGNRWFRVRLHLQKPRATRVAHYVVVGRSPLWVYRQEDFERMHNWQGYR